MRRPDQNLFTAISALAAERGAAQCWEVPGREPYSWARLGAEALQYAGALGALGVGPDDRVLVQVDKSPEALLLYLGCLAAGAVCVPLNPAYTPAETCALAADAEPRLIVCGPAREPELRAAMGPDTAFSTLDAHAGGRLPEQARTAPPAASVPRSSSDPAAILYTSGTTGRSRGALLSHGNLRANAGTLIGLWEFSPQDVLLHVLPVYHTHGLFVATHCALLTGARTMLLPQFSLDAVFEHLPRATVFMGVPTHYTRLLADPRLDHATCRGMRLFVSGSAPLLAATFVEFERRTGHRILERYGMSEAGIIASNPCAGARLAGSVGYALPGVEARVADDQGQERPHGDTGVLEIRGPGVFHGYWRREVANAAAFRADGFFVTGDLAQMGADGRICIVGRARDLVISGGLNIYPQEIELELDALEVVVESAVIGVPHADLGEAAIAIVVRAPGAALTEPQLLNALRARLARFKLPKRVVFVDALPRNAMGKVQKARLREQYAGICANPSRPRPGSAA